MVTLGWWFASQLSMSLYVVRLGQGVMLMGHTLPLRCCRCCCYWDLVPAVTVARPVGTKRGYVVGASQKYLIDCRTEMERQNRRRSQ
jgi:hypothetical protein